MAVLARPWLASTGSSASIRRLGAALRTREERPSTSDPSERPWPSRQRPPKSTISARLTMQVPAARGQARRRRGRALALLQHGGRRSTVKAAVWVGGAVSGRHGLLRLHWKARGCPSHSTPQERRRVSDPSEPRWPWSQAAPTTPHSPPLTDHSGRDAARRPDRRRGDAVERAAARALGRAAAAAAAGAEPMTRRGCVEARRAQLVCHYEVYF